MVGLVAHHGDGQVHLGGEQPGRGGNGIKPRHQLAHVVDQFLRRDTRAGKFRKQVDELAILQVTRHLVLGLRCQQSRQPGLVGCVHRLACECFDQFARRPGQREPGGERLAQRNGRGQLEHHGRDQLRSPRRTELPQQVVNLGGPVGREHPEGIARLVVQVAAGDIDDDVPRFLVRARLVEQPVLAQPRGKRVVLAVNAGLVGLVPSGLNFWGAAREVGKR